MSKMRSICEEGKRCTKQVQHLLLVAMRYGDTPVLIPNTMVKTIAADDTILETVWESRWLPDSLKIALQKCFYIERAEHRDVQDG